MRAMMFALLAGAASVFAFAPFGVSPLAFVCLGTLFMLLHHAPSARRAAALGFVWGLGAFLAGVGWLYVALHQYGGMPALLAGLAVLLFCAYLALFPMLASVVYHRLRRQIWWADALLAGAAWAGSEYLRGWLFTGFPWLTIGYTQTPPSPLAGWAPVFGVFGLSFIVASLAALAVSVLVARRSPASRRAWAPLLAVLIVCLAGAGLRRVAWTTPVGEPLDVALLQTNIPQDLKWQPEQVMRWLELNYALVARQEARLVVLPETSLPVLTEQLPAGYLEALKARIAPRGADLIVGAFTREGEQIFNSAFTLGTAPAQRYSKNHLVPFGEYSPPLFGWFYRLAAIPMSDQSRGGSPQAPLALAGQQIAVNICYEDVFGAELLHALPQASMLLNLSNLAWYGDSHAQPQHLQIARLRALETGRPMLRATNTGMTAVIQPDGQVSAALPAFRSGALRQRVTGYQGRTPYTLWADWPLIFVALGVVLAAWRRREQVAC